MTSIRIRIKSKWILSTALNYICYLILLPGVASVIDEPGFAVYPLSWCPHLDLLTQQQDLQVNFNLGRLAGRGGGWGIPDLEMQAPCPPPHL